MTIKEVPSLINGQFLESEQSVFVSDYEGKPLVKLFGATPIQARIAKRAMLQIQNTLARADPELLIRIVKRSAEFYFSEQSDYEMVARLSGSPISYVNESIGILKHWLSTIDRFVENAFGNADYHNIPILVGEEQVGYRRYVPTAPTVVVLPQNDDGISAYILSQMFLSKNPVLVKPSSSGGSAYSTMLYIDALRKAILEEAPDQKDLLKAVQMVNILDQEGVGKAEQIANLGIEGANFVLFGSNEVLEQIESAIKKVITPRSILSLGTGFSVSLVLADADLEHAASEVFDSVTEDRGNKCTTTQIVYVHEDVYDDLRERFDQKAALELPQNPFDVRTRIGCLDTDTWNAVVQRVTELKPAHTPDLSLAAQVFSLCEMEEHDHVEELPGPVLFMKKVRSVDDFNNLLVRDCSRNGMERNLCTSVYTQDKNALDAVASHLPTHIVKWNIGTHAINFFIEHQSMYLIREVMDQRVVEMVHSRNIMNGGGYS